MLKVAYDISTLGQGFINPKAKTGVYRVVESLFFELVKSSEIETTAISFNQINSIWENISASLYLQNQTPEKKTLFDPCFVSRFNLTPIYQAAIQLQRQLIQVSLKKYPILYKPSLSIQIPFKLISKLDVKSTFSPYKFNIYHSPFYPTPHCTTTQNLQRVLTIYDLLPILTPHNFTQNSQSRFKSIINSIDRHQDWIICISENTKQDFCNHTGMNPERVFVTPLAASENFYPVSDRHIISQKLKQYQIPDTPYLLSLCTLEPRKNLSFLLECFAQLLAQDHNLDLSLVLVGVSGWKNNDIFQTVQNNPLLKKHVIFTGYIPDHDLSAIYSGALAFVYPSLYEGFGLPPLEAMQCSTPVITSNTSSLPEVVGDAGLMINPTSRDDLCQAMLNLINNSTLRSQLSQKGIDRAAQFSWSKCAKETIKVYKVAANS
ncbi:glycosyltransferase family 4 protein [Pseudanabaena sp. ABRG5-3]|uniref:glycosyltransferase family 4 protein n=1 Tax=Pseudanabaena sp. ABRG5-3 TaxID=685565 RepID=UPI000DC7242A|nr:glycosyltransferase family 1 protein [Pseudanabaena sp. ABRG5-3]BBC22808.1 group 1 glycosyl transferase [Pseudanabaena sp. ABRG5-3]